MQKINLKRDLNQLENISTNTPLKKMAMKRFKQLGLPNKDNEKYHYFKTNEVFDRDLNLIIPSSAKEIKKSNKIVITDGVVTEICDGVTVGCSTTMNLDRDHFDPLYYLGHSLSGDVISMRFGGNITVKIEHHFTKANSLIAYRVAIYTELNSNVTIEESFVSDEVDESLVIFGNDIFLAEDSSLRLIKSQTLAKNSFIPIASHSFDISSGASLVWRSFDFGDGNGLELAQARLQESASITATHLLFADKDANRGVVSKFIHEGEHSRSNQFAKNILKDSARGIFDALIEVQNSATYSVAHQNSKTILLNDGVFMASKPQLEIYIDELEASHGSTTGWLDEKALFYLRSRGIDDVDAKKMLILAFANELIEMIESDEIKNLIYRDFELFYYGKSEIECIQSCHNCEEIILQ